MQVIINFTGFCQENFFEMKNFYISYDPDPRSDENITLFVN